MDIEETVKSNQALDIESKVCLGDENIKREKKVTKKSPSLDSVKQGKKIKPSCEEDDTTLPIPTATTKKMMKFNDAVHNVSADAVICVSKSVELFLEFLAKGCYDISLENNKKSVKVFNLI